MAEIDAIPSIQMVDVRSQYLKIKKEVDSGIQEVIDSCAFINGPKVKSFKKALEKYLGVECVIPVANGTDALQIAMMALDLKPGDEVIVPAFTYVATAEVIGLLGLKPKMVDVDPHSFNITADIIERAISDKTKAVVPVHLFGQNAEMEGIMKLSQKHNFYVIEDNAQAIGSEFIYKNGSQKKSGTIGHIGCTSFYPSKNLGAYGDGGAIFTNDKDLGEKIRMVANHGQGEKYVHDIIGCNSRLDAIQAAILEVKLKHLDSYCKERQKVAQKYDEAFAQVTEITTPFKVAYSSHVYHQYTLRIKNGQRENLKTFLAEKGVPSMIYYPIPLYKQKAFAPYAEENMFLSGTEQLCQEVLSLPIHTEMTLEQQDYIIKAVLDFYKK